MQALQSTPDTPDDAPEVEWIRAKKELSPPLGFWR